MKIAIFSHSYLPKIGGVQFLVRDLINCLNEETNNEIILFAPYYSKNDKKMEIIFPRIKIYRIFNPNNFISVIIGTINFLKIVKKETPEIIHGQTLFIDGFFCYIVKKLLGVPYVLSTQGELNFLKKKKVLFKDKLMLKLSYIFFKNSKYLITPEKYFYNVLRKLFRNKKKIKLINDYIYISKKDLKQINEKDLLKKYGIEKNKYFIYMSRLKKEKGIYILLKAIENIRNILEEKGIRLIVFGEGDEKKNIINYIRKKSLDNIVIYGGVVFSPEKWILLKNARYSILPSFFETQPISIIESFFVNTPVIGSDIFEIKAMIKNKILGYTFENKNNKDLSRILLKAIKGNNKLVNDNKKCFKEESKKYNLENKLDKFLELYRN